MLDTTVARWSISADGDVVERIADHPVCVWHTGNEAVAKALIAERRAIVEQVYIKHLRNHSAKAGE